ncbi:MAG: chemotaxis protein CheB [Hymenobacter sp.]|nr:MAG: chemotaxis protein CheB [Hymenobacter sp.]
MKDKYLIAIGASAGGLAALNEFFDNTLPDGVSYVITTHLHPHQKSILTELIQKHAVIEICDAEDGLCIEQNKVYIMPENKVMTINGERLFLEKRDLSVKINMAVDIFFLSLAGKSNHYKTIAIVLSGMGNDGTKGAAAIAAGGGTIIAQTPRSCSESSMPESVIASGVASFVLAPKDMPGQIIRLVSKSKLIQ